MKCATKSGGPERVRESYELREFHRYFERAVEVIKPGGVTGIDDMAATRPY